MLENYETTSLNMLNLVSGKVFIQLERASKWETCLHPSFADMFPSHLEI